MGGVATRSDERRRPVLGKRFSHFPQVSELPLIRLMIRRSRVQIPPRYENRRQTVGFLYGVEACGSVRRVPERTDLDSSVYQNALGSELIEIAAEAEGFEFRLVDPFDT